MKHNPLNHKVMMVAGEASGDLLGGTLLAALLPRFPQLSIIGVGGERMRSHGLQGQYDINDLSVVGLVEVIQCFPRLRKVFLHLTHLLEVERPKLLITIDLPDFNFMLAKRAKKLGIPVVHYVGPQVWAWRRGRIKHISTLLNHLMVLFPFEPTIYAKTPLPVTFVGHPLVELLKPPAGNEDDRQNNPIASAVLLRRSLGLTAGEKLLVLLPGSRHGEVQRLLPTMVETCQRIRKEQPGVRFVLALADSLSEQDVQARLSEVSRTIGPEVTGPEVGGSGQEGMAEIIIRQGQTHALLAVADVALVASGTATLETALIGTPMVVVYRVNRLTYEIGRRLIQVPYISLANLVAGYGLVSERIQDEAEAGLLAADLLHLLTNAQAVEKMRGGFAKIRQQLSQPSRQAADVIADFL